MRLLRYLQITFLTTLVIAISMPVALRSVAAISSTPAFVLGVTNPLDPLIVDLQGLTSSVTMLGSVSSLTLVGGNSILFVDGSWLASVSSVNPALLSQVAAEPLAGIPTVTTRGNPALLSTSITGLLRWHAPDLPLISEGLRITGSRPDGTRISSILQVVSGFDYAVQAEFTWANNLLAQGTAAITPSVIPSVTLAISHNSVTKTTVTSTNTTSSTPSWVLTGYLQLDTGDGFSPYGRIISTFTAYQLSNSGSATYVWYNLFFNQTIMPGIMIFNSPWRTSNQYALVHDQNTTSTTLVDHGPKGVNNSGPFVVSYQIGTYAGILNATVTSTQSRSYALKNTNVTDTSQTPDVSWRHDINSRTSSGTLTFQVIPGVTIRYLQGGRANITLGVATSFIQLQGNSIVGSKTITYGMFPG